MMKCKSCGEINADNSKFCSFCGKPFAMDESAAIKDALENAQKRFEKDSLVSLDRSRITYICTVCGTVNSIDRDRCLKCGKPRPRNEFVSALKKVKQGLEYKDASKQPAKDIDCEEESRKDLALEREEVPVQQPKQALKPQQAMDSPYVGGGGQANSIIQPFVVVPYVNQNQPIWQNRPRQLFRFEPYSQEEIQELKNQRSAEEKALVEVAELKKLTAPVEKNEDNLNLRHNTKGVRIVAAILLLLSMASVALFFLLKAFQEKELIFFAAGIGDCISGVFPSITLFDSMGYGYSGWTDFIAPVALIVFILLVAIILVRSFVRLLKGLASRKGFVLPLFALVFFLLGVVGLVLKYHSFTSDGFDAFFKDIDFGLYIALAVPVLMLIISLFSPVNTEKRRMRQK